MFLESVLLREYMKLYLRELLQIVTELMTGNYTIIRLPEGGSAFMEMFGGTLADNLEAGHRLCCELYSDREQYDPNFLHTIMVGPTRRQTDTTETDKAH